MNCNNRNYNVPTNQYNTPAEWRYNGELEIAIAEEQHQLAKRLALEADCLIEQGSESVVKNKQEVDHENKVKVKDLEYVCYEIEKKKSKLIEELDILEKYRTHIEYVKESLIGDSLEINAECRRLRYCRTGKDLVSDDVETELIREQELFAVVKDKLEDLWDEVGLEIRNLREFLQTLVMDLRYKQNTLKIEVHNEQLNENNIEKSMLKDTTCLKPATISVAGWNRLIVDALSETDKTLLATRSVHTVFDTTLSKLIEDLKTQASAVDRAISLRVDEYRELIDKFKTKKIKTIKRIAETENTIEKLRKALADKEAYSALVRTRLLNRSCRDAGELCRDELEEKLYEEANELENTVRGLQKTMADSTVCLRQLKQLSIRIDLQLKMKENSLHIDNELCVDLRERINYDKT